MGLNVTGPFRLRVAEDGTMTWYFGPPPEPNPGGNIETSTVLMEMRFPCIIESPNPFPPLAAKTEGLNAIYPYLPNGEVDWDSGIFWYPGFDGVEPEAGFWTNFRKCSEIGGGSDSPPFIQPDLPPAEETGELPRDGFVASSLPYSKALGAIGDDGVWFRATLRAGTYRFHTVDSPDPVSYDTEIIVFTSPKDLPINLDFVDFSGDISANDLRSDLTVTVDAGDYFIYVFAENGPIPAGTIFKLEAA